MKANEREFNIDLVINRVDDKEEGTEVFEKLQSVSEKFLQVNLSLLGFLPADLMLISSVKKQNPVSVLFPDSGYAKSIKDITYKILDLEEDKNEENEENTGFAGRILKFFGRNK